MSSALRIAALVVLGLATVGACVLAGDEKQEVEADATGAGGADKRITPLKQEARTRDFLPGGICPDPHKELRGHILDFYFDAGDEAPDFAIPRLEVLAKAIEGKEFMSTKEYIERFSFRASYGDALYELPTELPADHPDKELQCEKVRPHSGGRSPSFCCSPVSRAPATST